MKRSQCMVGALLALATTLACALPISAIAQASAISFDNKSGEPALVKLVGPTAASVQVSDKTTESLSILPGRYRIKVRYGSRRNFRYVMGEEFQVAESETTISVTTIALHAMPNGNYATRSITANVFDGSEMVAAQDKADAAAGPDVTAQEVARPLVLHRQSEEYDVLRMLLDSSAASTLGEQVKHGLGKEESQKVEYAFMLGDDMHIKKLVSEFKWKPPDLPSSPARVHIPNMVNTKVVVTLNGKKIWSEHATNQWKYALSPLFDVEKGEDGAVRLSISVDSLVVLGNCMGGVDNIYLLKPKAGSPTNPR